MIHSVPKRPDTLQPPKLTHVHAHTITSTASNNLQGSLPKELCCLPILENLDLSNNGMAGMEPLCLAAAGFSSLDLSGNEFGEGALQSLESP
jgi:hypothetical protein